MAGHDQFGGRRLERKFLIERRDRDRPAARSAAVREPGQGEAERQDCDAGDSEPTWTQTARRCAPPLSPPSDRRNFCPMNSERLTSGARGRRRTCRQRSGVADRRARRSGRAARDAARAAQPPRTRRRPSPSSSAPTRSAPTTRSTMPSASCTRRCGGLARWSCARPMQTRCQPAARSRSTATDFAGGDHAGARRAIR